MTALKLLKNTFSRLFLPGMMLLCTTYSMAQDGGAKIPDINNTIAETATGSETWYSSPLYLIIGGLLLVLIIVAIARGHRRE